jgi:hypothetical protein
MLDEIAGNPELDINDEHWKTVWTATITPMNERTGLNKKRPNAVF